MIMLLKKWSDILTIVNGKNQKDVVSPDGQYPIYGSGGVIGCASSYLCEAGTTIIGRKGTINSPIFVDKKFWNVDTAFGISPGKELIPKFLYYFCCSFNFTELDKSTTIPSLAKRDLLQIKMPVPSIEEQERIVSKIEELFSRLDASVAELQTAKEKLKIYRQTVLYKAFQNLTDTITMDEVADMIDPQPSHRTPPEVSNGVPYVGVGDIDYSTRKINFAEARKVSSSVLQEHQERYTIHKGDFIMGKIGTIGKPFMVPLPQNYTLSANVILIQPNYTKILPEFLYWQFSAPLVTQQLTVGAAATSQPAFGIKKARLLSIRICDIEQQRQITNEIEKSLSVCDSIEQTIDISLHQAEALRQSILKRAFEGEL